MGKGPFFPPLEETTRVAGRIPSRRIVLVIVTIALFMSTVDLTIVATALPAIHRTLRATINWAGWTITSYGLGMVIALPISGKLSDQYGRRRVLAWGVVLFTAASMLCGVSTNIYMLIAFRAVQAIGGGAFQPSATGLVADHFGKDRDRAIGMFGTIAATGQVVGPVLGGVFVGYLSWRWIFFVNVPIGVVLLALVVRYIPPSRPVARRQTDVHGLVLTGLLLFATVLAITDLGDGQTAIYAPSVLFPALFAVVAFSLFVRHTKRAAAPLIPVKLLLDRGFAAMNVENLLLGVVAFGVASLVPLYAQQRYGLPALGAGTLLAARAVGMITVGAVAAFALRRTGYRLPLVVGFAIMAGGTLWISIAPRWGCSSYAWLSIGAGLTGLGNGVANPASRNACLQLAPDDVASVSGLRSMFLYIGTVLGVAVTTAVLGRSGDPGLAQAHILWVVAGILVFVMLPLAFRIPEHKGVW